MTTTMQLIAKQTVGADGAASVTFSSIPDASKGYTDLKLVTSVRSTASGNYTGTRISFNGTSYTANFSAKGLYGNGASAASENWTSSDFLWATGSSATASTFASDEIYIPNYTSSNNKSMSVDMVTENNATTALAYMLAGLWSNSGAITSITLTPSSGSFAEFSTFYLYGISNSTTTQNTSVPYASGGDVITTDGSYWYHAFKYSGSFTPLKNLTADVLVVAGAGGGGFGYNGAGGGAGGLAYQAARSVVANTSLTCTIGAGGAGSTNTNNKGNNGSNSVFDTITANGGGGAGSRSSVDGAAGGSGGGGSQAGAGATGGVATQSTSGGATGYGFRGGNTNATANLAGTGGGGAGAQGEDKLLNGTRCGDGGAGLNTWSSWATATSTGASGYYAGGGGGSSDALAGGNGGAGGGANGVGPGVVNGLNGTANTGGGGSGCSSNSGSGGTGGSGIIIVRYAV
jgi:hypothetical protein